MRKAMHDAEVGDDVYREDPTVNRLQDRAAEIFGREAGLYVVSGTMGNQTAIKVLTRHGQEVICEDRCHIYNFEMGMLAAFSGVVPRTLHAEDGILTWDLIAPHVRSRNDHRARTGLIELENTSNLAGGSVYPLANTHDIVDRAHAAGLPVHLDGARIFNASVTLGKSVVELTRKVDSVMFCLSKGLGAPVGSMLVGSKEFIEQARIIRKMLGGSMRQRAFWPPPASSRWRRDRSGSASITPMRGFSPRNWRRFPESRLMPPKWSPTSCSLTFPQRAFRPMKSPSGWRRKASWRTPRARNKSAW